MGHGPTREQLEGALTDAVSKISVLKSKNAELRKHLAYYENPDSPPSAE